MAGIKWVDHVMVSLEWVGEDLVIREILPMVPFLDKNFGSPLDAICVLRRRAVGKRGAGEGEIRAQELDYVNQCSDAFEKYLEENIRKLIDQNPGDETLKFRNVANILFRVEYTCERFQPIMKVQQKMDMKTEHKLNLSIRNVVAPLNVMAIESLSIREALK